MPLRPLLCAALLALLTGCGGGSKTKTIVKTVTQPPTTTEVQTATITTPEPATDTTATINAPPSSGTPVSGRHGKLGDTFILTGSQFAHVPKGKTSGPRDRIAVTLTGTIDPITGYQIDKGDRLLGLRMTVKNVGKVRYVDYQPSGDLTLVGGGAGKPESLISTGPEACKDPSIKLKPGASASVCMAFEVPKRARLESFQYTSDIGDGQSGVWKLR